MRRCITAAVVAVLVVVLAAGGAAAKTVPAAQWAPKFCAALSAFEQHLSKDGTQADAVLSGNITSLAEAKSTLAGFMAKAVKDADTAISALKHAGTPDASNGAKLAGKFISAFQTLRGFYLSAQTQAQHLPTKGLSGFESATKKLTSDLNKGAASITASFKTIQSLDTSGKIAAAFHATPSCAFLQNA